MAARTPRAEAGVRSPMAILVLEAEPGHAGPAGSPALPRDDELRRLLTSIPLPHWPEAA
jgi:hypothetical protein